MLICLSAYLFVEAPTVIDHWSSILMFTAAILFLALVFYGVKYLKEVSSYDLNLTFDEDLTKKMHEELFD